MPSYKNFSFKSRKEKDGSYENYNSPDSHDPIKQQSINQEEWIKFISYYRYYIDEFATDILGVKLYPFQRVILRAMARYQNSMLIMCRGLGKSWLTALFMVCMAILYPGIKIGIASGVGQQARMVIIQKIKEELDKNNPEIAREIKHPIRTQDEDCAVEFWNGSVIRAITLGQQQRGDSARGWRFNIILVDEARLVRDSAIEEVLVPMTKTKRPIMVKLSHEYGDKLPIEKGKMIYISSAYLKTCDLYKRFLHHYYEMKSGNMDYFTCSLPYQVGVKAGLFYEDDILKELDKPSMTREKFEYEFNAVFVGSSSESYYPYELTEKCRELPKCELQQPKGSRAEYIVVHDVAMANEARSDNACTTVIKLKPRANGTYIKEVVFIKSHKGMTLTEQRDYLRELVHIKFPNTKKLVIDIRGNGEPLKALFYESWIYENDKGESIELPPLIDEDDGEARKNIPNALTMLKCIAADNNFNNTMYSYMKSSFEDGSIRLLIPSTNIDSKFKSGQVPPEEYAVHVETDNLIQELGNIKQTISAHGNIRYVRISGSMKKDKATSLGYGLAYIQELEIKNKMSLFNSEDDAEDYLFFD